MVRRAGRRDESLSSCNRSSSTCSELTGAGRPLACMLSSPSSQEARRQAGMAAKPASMALANLGAMTRVSSARSGLAANSAVTVPWMEAALRLTPCRTITRRRMPRRSSRSRFLLL
ncbi:Uncharacterised protein [Bordetella pertussis]|nr:Uncharacterised protein [Bordetella pertussis]CFP62739.1 Uncharacterised protein [Bordetella pertussis]CFT96487.1 Uncharacterised protein [Bordetella pertussis]CFW04456.1 Uncharacterised protein [Bordetella pertussis]CFW33558.1 Uncharacterised protein [Bordetella pertussis]